MTSDTVLRELEGLRALARSLVRGDAEADDLIQDTAVAAITHPPDEARPVRPWLATVLKNRWRMNRRSENRRKAREEAAQFDDAGDATEESIDRARVLEKLSAALVALEEPFRTTVVRRYLDGQSAAEIARSLGIPPGTVRWRLKNGLDRLRAALDETTPRWQRALIPIAAGKGALLVKAKTTVIAVIALVAALGVGIVVIARRGRGGDDVAETTPSGSAGVATMKPGRTGTVPEAALTSAKPEVTDPRPGQGRAIVEAVVAEGGLLGGRIINWSTGAGVGGAELTFSSAAGASTIRTKDDGGFELAPDKPGVFELTAVVSPGYLPYAPELAHSPVRAVLAKGSAVRGITVFLFPAVDYTGTVVDAALKPVAGAKVRLLSSPQGEQAIEKLATEWTSDTAGNFTFHAADYAVFEAVKGKARGWMWLDGDAALTHHMTIQILDAPAREATIAGVTLDETGQPLPDVLVRADPDYAGNKDPIRATAFATSGPDGSFVLEGLDKSSYSIAAELEERAPVFVKGVSAGTKNLAIEIPVGDVIAGAVATTAGEAVPAYTLLVMKREGTARHVLVAESVVDPKGRFEIHVPPGDYELLASASGLAPSTPTPVSSGTKNAKLVVSIGAVLRGKVVKAGTDKGLPYARLMREAPGGGASATPANAGTVTREDGTFELTGIPPGPVSITVGAGGFHPKIEAGMTAVDGGEIGPLVIHLTELRDGEKPTLELVGIGVKLAPDGDALRVDGVFPGSGAEGAGIVVGDRLIAVDGLPVTTLGLDGAVSKIRGTVGTTVAVSVKRGDKVIQLVVERKKLKA